MRYSFGTLSKAADKGRFDWCVYLDELPQVISTIEYVRYLLHPSFPNPERITRDADSRFAVYSNGWGNFVIHTEVRTKDRKVEHGEYKLQLEADNWPTKSLGDEPLSAGARKIYDLVAGSTFSWRKLGTIVARSGQDDTAVHDCLKELQQLNLVRPAHFNSKDGQALFGVTAKVGIRP